MGKNTRNTPPPPDEEDAGAVAAVDIEALILGALLVNAERNLPIVRELSVSDFYTERHRRIFLRALELDERGERIDRVTITNELKKRRQLESVGGATYLSSLDQGLPDIVNLDAYVGIVKDKSLRRRVILFANGLEKRAFLPTEETGSVIAAGAEFFQQLQAQNGQKEVEPSVPAWPDPIHADGFHGIAGDLVRVIEPHTEADRAALLVQLLVGWGSLTGRGSYYLAEADHHHTNEYCVLVGTTSKARKGTSWGRIGHVLGVTDPHWMENRLLAGLGSGEALIDAVGEEDRRTLVIESEFARLLAVVSRDGSTISASLRNGWDSGTLAIRTRQKAVKVTGAHLSMIGHITREELLRRLDSTETANGFANRILFCCARRSNVLPHGGGNMEVSSDLLNRLQRATEHARKMGNTRVQFDAEASQLWEQVYPDLSEGQPGLLGSMTSRAEAHVVRLALIYTLLDTARAIGVEHLRAALAVWNYCAASARYIWGNAIGDPTADEILRALRAGGCEGLTRWDIVNHFSRHKKAEELDRAIGVLAERGLIRSQKEETGGRESTRYWAA